MAIDLLCNKNSKKYCVTVELQQQRSLLLWKYNVQCMKCGIMVNIRDCRYAQKPQTSLPGATVCCLCNVFYMRMRRDCGVKRPSKVWNLFLDCSNNINFTLHFQKSRFLLWLVLRIDIYCFNDISVADDLKINDGSILVKKPIMWQSHIYFP